MKTTILRRWRSLSERDMLELTHDSAEFTNSVLAVLMKHGFQVRGSKPYVAENEHHTGETFNCIELFRYGVLSQQYPCKLDGASLWFCRQSLAEIAILEKSDPREELLKLKTAMEIAHSFLEERRLLDLVSEFFEMGFSVSDCEHYPGIGLAHLNFVYGKPGSYEDGTDKPGFSVALSPRNKPFLPAKIDKVPFLPWHNTEEISFEDAERKLESSELSPEDIRGFIQ